MAGRLPGDKPLSEPMMVSLLTHICVTRPQWVNSLRLSEAYMYHQPRPSLVQAPSHFLNQCCIIVNWTLRNKLQWHFNWNLNILIQENAYEYVVWEMSAILPWHRCVNLYINASSGHKVFSLQVVKNNYQFNNLNRVWIFECIFC